MNKQQILDMPTGTEFNFRGYSAIKVSSSRIRVVYPMRSPVYLPINNIKEYHKD